MTATTYETLTDMLILADMQDTPAGVLRTIHQILTEGR